MSGKSHHPSKINRLKYLLAFVALLFLTPGIALAQTYSFSLPQETVNVYWNEDGTSSIDYLFIFTNDSFASPIDYVDVGVPNKNYDLNSVVADVEGQVINDIEESPYVDPGIAVGLGSNAIQPGKTGQVHVNIGRVERVLYPDDTDDTYASGEFIPTWFDSSFVHGNTNLTVIFHLPPGVQPEQPRWHTAPSGWPSEPVAGIDDQNRITYTWHNPNAVGYAQYTFGASFPAQYVPKNAIVRPNPFAGLIAALSTLAIPLLCIGMVVFFIYWAVTADRKRKMKYLPPKISIEGHGIKRGLTAVEAGILMEQPMDKILTMILFSVLKKNAAQVKTRDPLELELIEPLPEGLNAYEKDFLAGFSASQGAPRRKALQKTMVDLVKSVGDKMKGFSRRETVAYYRDITARAWTQVEAADTPEVKSEKFDEVMEWTMLDHEYEDRTKEVFRQGPVFVPMWWPRYDPSYGRSGPGPIGLPTTGRAPGGSPGPSLPHLPGAEFAASMATGVQNFSSKVVGNITEFTSGITNITNPPPKPTSSGRSFGGGGSGGHSCACACACAGCACACAGGGR
ncbi:MAG: hypothetical protein A2Z45_04355 [Chloroflexi bacterium RBG_19FT_COMBO_55_16]|nr:MAG: hypothetical protein A2Z45_04355 [Chloroflexi bacterium RBG_19FT_COMBO_55_16]